MTTVFRQVGAEFARDPGHKLDDIVDNRALMKRLRSGETTEIVLVSAQDTDHLDREHLVLPGSQMEIAGAKIGVSERRGAASPDLSTPDAFKRAMLMAHSIALVDPKAGGISGIYLDGLLQRLGIADEVKKNAIWADQGL
jgi:molybdate transport system substrate-binding protein